MSDYSEIHPKAQRRRIGQEIAALRKEKGMTQKEMAKSVGITQGGISMIEQGLYSAGFDLLERIAELLGKKIVVGEEKYDG